MAYDLKYTFAQVVLGKKIASTSASISQEGALLCGVLEDGIEKCTLVAAPAGTEKVIGFSRMGDALPMRTSEVEKVVVPLAPATLELDLRNTNLVSGFIRVVNLNTNVALTVDTVFAGAPGAGVVKVNLATGRLKFNAAESGVPMQVTYLYDLTFMQAVQKFGQRSVNNTGIHSAFAQMEIGSGLCELWTDQYDASQDYSADPVLKLGANGFVTVGGPGVTLKAKVIGVPAVENPKLGIRISFDPA